MPASFKEPTLASQSLDSGDGKQNATKASKTKVGKGEAKKDKEADKSKGGDPSGGTDGEGETLPLQLRRHGFDVYWNGRLIPEAHFERYCFLCLCFFSLVTVC